jgi:signal peptidase II
VISKRLAFYGVGLLVVALDRAGKVHALRTLEPGEHAAFLGNFLSLAHVRVSGTAFGLLQDWGPSAQLAFLGLLSFACAAVAVGFYRGLAPGEHGSAAALGAVLAGVIGNLFDRVRYGAGIDFLHVGPASADRLPDFNVSDLAIVLGVVTLIVELLASELAARAQERPRR